MKRIVYSDIFDLAWKDIRSNMALAAGISLVYSLATLTCSFIPYVGSFLGMAMTCGFVRCLMSLKEKGDFGYSDFFWAFANLNRLVHLFLLLFAISVGTVFGFIFFVFPGVWFLIASHFSVYLFVQQPAGEHDAFAAIKQSLQLAKDYWWQLLGLSMLIMFLNVFGAICFLFGLLVSFPMTVYVYLHVIKFLQSQKNNATVAAAAASAGGDVTRAAEPDMAQLVHSDENSSGDQNNQ